MTYKSLIYALWIALFMSTSGCSSGQFSGEKDKDDESKGSDKNAGDEEAASDPVMVGGAYLACAFLSKPDASGGAPIGCALTEKSSSRKIDLSAYDSKWIVSENSKEVYVKSMPGAEDDPYHRKLIYKDKSYRRHSLRLDLSRGSKSYTYYRELKNLDASLVLERSLAYALEYSARVTVSPPGDCHGDPVCLGQQVLTAITGLGGFCRDNGILRSSVIAQTFLGSAQVPNPDPLPLDPVVAGKCVLDSGSVTPHMDNNCYVVPFLGKNNMDILYYVIPKDSIPAGLAREHLNSYVCR